jgi:hypothetical protein
VTSPSIKVEIKLHNCVCQFLPDGVLLYISAHGQFFSSMPINSSIIVVSTYWCQSFVPSEVLPVGTNKKALEFQGLCFICGGDAGT